MAENVDITPGSGDVVAADDISGVKYQRVKLVLGDNNVNDGDVSSSNPVPTEITGTVPLPTGAATAANQQTDALTDTELRATPVPVSGTVTANAGTNLNTSALALETGGNLAAAAASLAILDNIVSGSEAQVDIVAPLPAGTNLIGRVSSSDETSTIYDGTTALTPKFVAIAASSSGNNTVLAAVTGKKIRVLAVQINASAAVNFKWQSGAGGTDLTGLNYAAANGGYVLPYNPVGWFETASNTLLNLNLSAANAVGGSLTYCEV